MSLNRHSKMCWLFWLQNKKSKIATSLPIQASYSVTIKGSLTYCLVSPTVWVGWYLRRTGPSTKGSFRWAFLMVSVATSTRTAIILWGGLSKDHQLDTDSWVDNSKQKMEWQQLPTKCKVLSQMAKWMAGLWSRYKGSSITGPSEWELCKNLIQILTINLMKISRE